MSGIIIKKLDYADYSQYIDITAKAYPGMKMSSFAEKERVLKIIKERVKSRSGVQVYGAFLNGKLAGGSIYYEFKMNFRGRIINMAGIGMVAVSLLNKKEHIAKNIIESFCVFFRDKKYPMASLYPFSPDFYRKMGFGYGQSFNHYELKPEIFENYNEKSHLFLAKKSDAKNLYKCYDEFFKENHGLYAKTLAGFKNAFKREDLNILAYKENGKIIGYIPFLQKATDDDNFLLQEMEVLDIVCNDRKALREFSTFFHSQKDQVNRITIDTQDSDFYHMFADPRNRSGRAHQINSQEINYGSSGIMYRILDIDSLFDTLSDTEYNLPDFDFSLEIKDDFLKENNRNLKLRVRAKKLFLENKPNSKNFLKINITQLSSLVTGSISLKKLYEYNLCEISDKSYIEKIDSVLGYRSKPVCSTSF